MRALRLLVAPLLLSLPFVACGGGSAEESTEDGGEDAYMAIDEDAPGEDVGVSLMEAGVTQSCALHNGTDPVGLCVQKAALLSLHASAFVPKTGGVAASWSSNSDAGTPDHNEAGVVPYSVDDTVAYAAAAVDYLSNAESYGDTTINALLMADLRSIALALETSFPVAQTEYSGELYFHLRTVAAGLRKLALDTDGAKFDTLAESYGRNILTGHYVSLGLREPAPDAGAEAGLADASTDAHVMDATLGDASKPAADADHEASVPSDAASLDGGVPEAGQDGGHDAASGGHDAASDAHKDATLTDAGAVTLVADGIIGNASGSKVTYATADVATAAYALLDLAARNPTDPSLTAWLAAARAALGHIEARAVEPSTGMFYTTLVASMDADGGTGGGDTVVATPGSTLPNDALLADTQATFALAMVRAQSLLMSSTPALSVIGDGGAIVDGGIMGPLLPVYDLPFEEWAYRAMEAMNGATNALWDAKDVGYMDAYVPSTGQLVTTKSTRPNAFMAGAIARASVNGDPRFVLQQAPLVQLLIANNYEVVPLNSNLITVLEGQTGFLRGATRTFFPLEAGPNPTSYTASAVTTAVEGLTEQVFAPSM